MKELLKQTVRAKKMRDGANINRSLLALANCINALGKQQKKGLAYVPYRNSKLTRILKDGLSGNSQTIMIATMSPADSQYHHTVNTLKYADRAKEIKTHIQKNIGTVNAHVSDYQKMIDNLQSEVSRLRKELAEKDSQLSAKPTEKAADDELSWLNVLSQETSENVQERINLQKALFELEETNLRNRTELQHLDDAIAKQQSIEKDGAVLLALQARRQVILDNIRDNDELGVSYQKEIEANEEHRCQLQNRTEESIRNNGNKTYLRILSQYRLLGIANIELQFEMAMRDQIIYNQREAHKNLWSLIMSLGLDEKQILDLGAQQGISIEDSTMKQPIRLSDRSQSPSLEYGRYTPLSCSSYDGQSRVVSPCIFPQDQKFISRSFDFENQKIPRAFCQEELHTASYYISHGYSSSAHQHWYSNQPGSGFCSLDQYSHGLCYSFPQMRSHNSPYSESDRSTSSLAANFGQQQQQQQDMWTHTNKQEGHENSCAEMSSPHKGVMVRHGEISQGFSGYSQVGQGSSRLNYQQFFPTAPSATQQSISQTLPSHLTSKFQLDHF